MESTLTGLEELTSAWLSAVFNQSGILGADHLCGMQIRPNPAFNSRVTHLKLEYSLPLSSMPLHSGPSLVISAPPSSVLLKLNQHGDGETEVLFYKQAAGMNLPMLVNCYAAQFDKNTNRSYLLLEDVSDTHQPPVTRQALLTGQGVPTQNALIGITA